MQGETSPKVKLVRSEFERIRIHDRRSFKSGQDGDRLLQLKTSHEKRPLSIKLKIKIRPESRKKETSSIENQLKADHANKIMQTLDDETLAIIIMSADPLRVINGLRKLAGSTK